METKQINAFKKKKKKNKKQGESKLRCACHHFLCVVIKPRKGEIETVSSNTQRFPKKRVISNAAAASVEVRSVSRQEQQLLPAGAALSPCPDVFCSFFCPGVSPAAGADPCGEHGGVLGVLGAFPSSAQPLLRPHRLCCSRPGKFCPSWWVWGPQEPWLTLSRASCSVRTARESLCSRRDA